MYLISKYQIVLEPETRPDTFDAIVNGLFPDSSFIALNWLNIELYDGGGASS